MNIISKIAYNALTKMVQVIAPGGPSIVIPGFDQTTINTIFTPNGAGSVASGTVKVGLTRVGKLVTLTLPSIGATPNGGSVVFESSVQIPVGYRPAITTFILALPITNAAAIQTVSGLFRIQTTGELLFYRDATTGAAFTNGSAAGTAHDTVFTFLAA